MKRCKLYIANCKWEAVESWKVWYNVQRTHWQPHHRLLTVYLVIYSL